MQEWLVVGLQQRLERLDAELVAAIHDEVIVEPSFANLERDVVEQMTNVGLLNLVSADKKFNFRWRH